jgi:hypothetical protein
MRQHLLRRCSREGKDLGDRDPQRLDPEVGLEGGQRLRERLGDRAGAEDRARYGPRIGDRRDGPALQHDQLVAGQRPLDVLRAAEVAGCALGELRQALQDALREGPPGGPLDDAARVREDVAVALDRPAHERVRAPVDRGDD